MKKFFSIGTNQAPVLITLLSVVVLAAVYLFVYIPQNEIELKEQRFRSLQRVADNVHKKIDNSVSLMDGLLKASFDKALKSSKVDNYIKEYDTSNFRLFSIDTAIDTTLTKQAQKKNISPIFSDVEDGTVAIKVNEATRKFRLYYAKRFPKNVKNDSCYYMSMLYNFENFVKPLLPVNVFDGYVIFSKGNVVYESFPSGLSYTNKDSLLGVQHTVAGSAIRDQEISGIKYKFFLQPVGFDSTNEWIVGGLLRDDRYNAEKKQLPANLVLFLMITAIVIIILLPWIKLFQMGSRDRLTLYDGGMSFFVAMLLTSMLFFIALWANDQFHNKETIQSEKNLSKNITAAFQREIAKAYNQIIAFDSLRYSDTINASIIKLGKGKDSSIDLYSKEKKSLPDSAEIKKVTGLINQDLSINQVFWLDSNGNDTYSWTKDKFYPPPGDFSKRKYFKNIVDKNCLFLESDTLRPFYIEPIVSWTSGTFRTVISIPSKLKDISANKEAVGAISVNIKSLDSVVMPAGCQFAITDDKGNVLYHYYIGRNLNENLLEEFSEKNELKGAYEAHAEKNFITDYYSKQYDVYVSPVKGLPYFLLILTDKSLVDTSNIEIFATTLSLTFIFFLFQFFLRLYFIQINLQGI